MVGLKHCLLQVRSALLVRFTSGSALFVVEHRLFDLCDAFVACTSSPATGILLTTSSSDAADAPLVHATRISLNDNRLSTCLATAGIRDDHVNVETRSCYCTYDALVLVFPAHHAHRHDSGYQTASCQPNGLSRSRGPSARPLRSTGGNNYNPYKVLTPWCSQKSANCRSAVEMWEMR